jgi:hypothetical protein
VSDKPDPKTPQPASAPRDGIPVRKLVFRAPYFDVPGKDAAGGLDCVQEPAPRSWQAWFLPALQAFRVDYHSHIPAAPVEECFIPASSVATWRRFIIPASAVAFK